MFQNKKTFAVYTSEKISLTSKIIFEILLIKLTANTQEKRIQLTARELMTIRNLKKYSRAYEQIQKAKQELKHAGIFESTFSSFIFSREFIDGLKRAYLLDIDERIFKLNLNKQRAAFLIARKIFWFSQKREGKKLTVCSCLNCLKGTASKKKRYLYKRRIENALNDLQTAGIVTRWNISSNQNKKNFRWNLYKKSVLEVIQ